MAEDISVQAVILQMSNNMNYAEAIGDWVKFRQKEENETEAEYRVEKGKYNFVQKQKKEQRLMNLIEFELQPFFKIPLSSEVTSNVQQSIVDTLDNVCKCGFITDYEVSGKDISEAIGGPFTPYQIIPSHMWKVTCTMFGFKTQFTLTDFNIRG